MKQTVYVVCRDYGYEGYGRPEGVFASLELLLKEYPRAVSHDVDRDTDGLAVYIPFEMEISSC